MGGPQIKVGEIGGCRQDRGGPSQHHPGAARSMTQMTRTKMRLSRKSGLRPEGLRPILKAYGRSSQSGKRVITPCPARPTADGSVMIISDPPSNPCGFVALTAVAEVSCVPPGP